jgi:hypothetical protein
LSLDTQKETLCLWGIPDFRIYDVFDGDGRKANGIISYHDAESRVFYYPGFENDDGTLAIEVFDIWPIYKKAVQASRSARFEYGENNKW